MGDEVQTTATPVTAEAGAPITAPVDDAHSAIAERPTVHALVPLPSLLRICESIPLSMLLASAVACADSTDVHAFRIHNALAGTSVYLEGGRQVALFAGTVQALDGFECTSGFLPPGWTEWTGASSGVTDMPVAAPSEMVSMLSELHMNMLVYRRDTLLQITYPSGVASVMRMPIAFDLIGISRHAVERARTLFGLQ